MKNGFCDTCTAYVVSASVLAKAFDSSYKSNLSGPIQDVVLNNLTKECSTPNKIANFYYGDKVMAIFNKAKNQSPTAPILPPMPEPVADIDAAHVSTPDSESLKAVLAKVDSANVESCESGFKDQMVKFAKGANDVQRYSSLFEHIVSDAALAESKQVHDTTRVVSDDLGAQVKVDTKLKAFCKDQFSCKGVEIAARDVTQEFLAARLFSQVLFAKNPKCINSKDNPFDPQIPHVHGGMLDPKNCVAIGEPLNENDKIRFAALNWWISNSRRGTDSSTDVKESWTKSKLMYRAHQTMIGKESNSLNERYKYLGGIMQQLQSCSAWQNIVVKAEQDYRAAAAACGSNEARYLTKNSGDRGAKGLLNVLKIPGELKEEQFGFTETGVAPSNKPYANQRRPANLPAQLIYSTTLSKDEVDPKCSEVLNRYSFYVSTIVMPNTLPTKNEDRGTNLFEAWIRNIASFEKDSGNAPHEVKVKAQEAMAK